MRATAKTGTHHAGGKKLWNSEVVSLASHTPSGFIGLTVCEVAIVNEYTQKMQVKTDHGTDLGHKSVLLSWGKFAHWQETEHTLRYPALG